MNAPVNTETRTTQDIDAGIGTGRAHRGFAGYDWANSGYVTVVTTAVGGPYLDHLAHGDSIVLPLTLVLAVLVQVALLPVLGRRVDRGADPVALIRFFAVAGGAAAVGLAIAPHWTVASLAMAVATICFGAAMVPYNALLPRLAPGAAADRLSARAFATGYVGGGVLLAAALVLLTVVDQAVGVRLAIAAAGVWWAGFALLACRDLGTVPAVPEARERVGALRLLRDLPQLRIAILGALLLGDAIGAVVSLSATVLTHELWTARGLDASRATGTLLAMVLLVQVLAAPFAFLTGRLAGRVGTKPVLLGCIGGWVLVMVGASTSLHRVSDVWVLAVGLAAVLGGSQTLSRSLISQLTPAGNAGVVFSLTQLAERGTAWMGPTLFAVVVGSTGSYRGALASVLVLFAAAAVLLSRVRPATGIAGAASYDPDAVYAARRLALPDAGVPTRRGRAAYAAICRTLRALLRPHVDGALPAGPVLVLANHLSVVDGPVLAVAGMRRGRQLRMLGTAGVFTAPVVGPLLLEAGMVPVKRRTSAASSALTGAQLLLEAGEAVALFPEGRIADGPLPGALRHGASRLALTTGVPVVLAGLSGTAAIVPRGTWRPRLGHRCAVHFAPVDLLARLGLDGPVSDPSDELVAVATEVLHACLTELVTAVVTEGAVRAPARRAA
jgi:UMF1 family MFS transporter